MAGRHEDWLDPDLHRQFREVQFEYSVRVQLNGNYQSGIAAVQCLYASEFNSHSESFEIEVK